MKKVSPLYTLELVNFNEWYIWKKRFINYSIIITIYERYPINLMNKKTLASLLDKWPTELKSVVKNVYNQLNDVRVFSLDDAFVTDDEFAKIIELTQKINKGEDITFDIGYRYFRNNKLQLKKGVFVPQYDTEQIVDLVINKITEGRFIEIGTGSGAIPISIVNETNMSGVTIDINNMAIELATTNFINNINEDKKDRLEFINIDLNEFNSNEKFDLVISNPPYIKYDDEHVEEWVRENQPREALYADDNGLAIYKTIVNMLPKILKPNGYIILEIGYNQSIEIESILGDLTSEVEVIKDYEQHDRFIVAKYNGK